MAKPAAKKVAKKIAKKPAKKVAKAKKPAAKGDKCAQGSSNPAAPCRPQDAQSINASLFPLCAPGLTRAPLRARRPKRAPSAYMNFCKKERA